MNECSHTEGRHSVTTTVRTGVVLRYRTDGKLFNTPRLQAKTKVRMTTVRDFLFADDCALNATGRLDMQSSMDRCATACTDFGLTVSTKKTEVMHQPAPGAPYLEPSITVDGKQLSVADKFVYLGIKPKHTRG